MKFLVIALGLFLSAIHLVSSATFAQSNIFDTAHAVIDNGKALPNGIAGYDLLSPNDKILVLDFNGDSKDDLLLYRPGTGAIAVRL